MADNHPFSDSGISLQSEPSHHEIESLSSDKMVRLFAKAGGLIGASLDETENWVNLRSLIVPQIADQMTLWLVQPNGTVKTCGDNHPPGLNDSFHDRSLMAHDQIEEILKTGLSIRGTNSAYFPLRVRHQSIGVLECHSHRGRGFETDDFIVLDEIARRTAIAFENVRLYQTLKSTERQLREATSQAESASSTKSQFLANMSHEIRTPLGAILGFVDLMLSPDESKQDCFVWGQKIKRNGQHLLRLIDEILDLSKIESGHLEINKQTFSLADFLQEIHLTLLPQAVQKGIQLDLHLESALPEHVHTDNMRLKQILFNLIGNSIKFTDRGKVTVAVRYLPQKDSLQFSIKDTGIGLTDEQAKRLFKPFSQGDSSHTRRFGGTGLGLILSRNLARMLGGDVNLISSVPGAGSTFQALVTSCVPSGSSFFRSLNPVANIATPSLAPETKKLKGRQILLVEDSPDNQFLIGRFLKDAGAHVDIAEDGARGLEMAMRGSYDVILMDIQMPLLNGHQVTEILRKNGDHRPILALTAHALKEELEKSLSAGCDDHLTKPIDRQKLIDLVAAYADRSKYS